MANTLKQAKMQKIASNLDRYRSVVEMPGGWTFDHTEMLSTIDHYYNGKFRTGKYDSKGLRKFFYNVTKPTCDIATKFVDIDTKDITLISETGADDLVVQIMKQDLRHWLKDTKFSLLLNEITVDYPKYGHVVIKKSKDGKWHKVQLENIRTDPGSQWLEMSDFVYEPHLMTGRDLRDMSSWDQEAISDLISTGEERFLVYEMYDYATDGDKKWKRTFTAIVNKERKGDPIETVETLAQNPTENVGVVLHEDEIDKLPYRELKWEDIPGRWLGRGFVEYLEDNQIRVNETENIKAKALALQGLTLFQTRDQDLGDNALTDYENGDIVKTVDQVAPIANENRNLVAFQQTEIRWDDNTQRKTFTSALARGEEQAANKPLGVAQLELQSISSFFGGKQENFGEFIRYLLIEDVIPGFRKSARKRHRVMFLHSDDERELVSKAIIDAKLHKEVARFIERTGFAPNREEVALQRQKLEQELRGTRNLHIDVPDGFYDNVNFKADVVVTGEQIDKGGTSQLLLTIIQTLTNNPAVIQNPQTRPAFFKMIELAGLSAADLGLLSERIEAAPAAPLLEQGGSIATPTAGNATI